MSYDSSNYFVDIMYSTVITAGQQATYTVNATNVGASASGAATVTDPLPSGLTWTQDDPSDCSIAATTLSCHFGTLQSGASRVVHLSATSSNANCNQVTRTGLLESTATGLDANTEDLDTLDKSSSASLVLNCPVPACPRQATSYPTLEPGSPFALFAINGVGKQQGTLYGTTIHGSAAVASGATLLVQSASAITRESVPRFRWVVHGPPDRLGHHPDRAEPRPRAAGCRRRERAWPAC